MPTLRRLVLAFAVATAALASTPATAREVQHHGLVFEHWIDDTFFGGYRPPGYTQKWDIPAAINTTHGGVPVNPKVAKDRTPVDLGDALRQFDIAEPFLLVIGYWRQDGDTKRFVNVVAVRVEPALWRKLWGPVTRADLERLDAIVKDRSLTPAAARAAALTLKRSPPFSQAVIEVNPKIGAKGQRRLQCSLSFENVFRHLAPDANPAPRAQPRLWDVALPDGIASSGRHFR
jgi:hypothetical protein